MTGAVNYPNNSRFDKSQQMAQTKGKKVTKFTYTPSSIDLSLYETLFQLADTTKNGKVVTQDEAFEVFDLSTLSEHKLKIIWTMISKDKTFVMSKKQFFVAIRLIQFTQNHQSVKDFKLSVPDGVYLKPPYFKGITEEELAKRNLSLVPSTLPNHNRYNIEYANSTDSRDSNLSKTREKSTRNLDGVKKPQGNQKKTEVSTNKIQNNIREVKERTTLQSAESKCECEQLALRYSKLQQEFDLMRKMLEMTMDNLNQLSREVSILKDTESKTTTKSKPQKQKAIPAKNSPLLDVKDLFNKIKPTQGSDNSSQSISSNRQFDNHFQTWNRTKSDSPVTRNVQRQSVPRSAYMKKNNSDPNIGAVTRDRSFRSHPDLNKKWPSQRSFSTRNKKQDALSDDDLSSISDHELNGNRIPKKEVESEPNFATSLLRSMSFQNVFAKRKKFTPQLEPVSSSYAMNFKDESTTRQNFELKRSAAFTLQMEKSLRCLNQSNISASDTPRRSDTRYQRYSIF